jgi:hypothetical protein
MRTQHGEPAGVPPARPRPPLRSRALDLRTEQVLLETDRWRIEGQLTLPREGFRSRLSDFVNQRDREFFSIRDAKLTALDEPSEVQELPFVMVASRHIRLIVPTSEEAIG